MVLQLIVNGPPGSGKTTLAKLLCEEFNLDLVATGDLLRENMKAQTTSGRRAQRCIAAKKLVPDRVVLDMVEAKVATCLARGRAGWVLDSFPRTTDQAESLMAKPDLCPAVVILLDLPEADCVAHSHVAAMTQATDFRRDSRRIGPLEKLRMSSLLGYQGLVHRVDASKSPIVILEDVSALLHSLMAKPRQIYLHNNNNQTQQVENTDMKVNFRQRPETILETSQDDDMQQYQYDWEDEEASIDHRRREGPQKQQQQPKETTARSAKKEGQNNQLSSSLMAALPLPVLQPRPESTNNNDAVPPPPAPMLRPLPPPAGKFRGLSGPTEISKSSVESAVARASISVRSSSSSSVRSNSSTTSLETAAASVDMETFKELLLDGFEAVKHGRRGRPHPRFIFTDLDFKRVFWQKAMGAADRVGKGKRARLEQSVVLGDVVQVARGMKTAVLKRSGNVTRYECYVSRHTGAHAGLGVTECPARRLLAARF
ncbi:hypothetical protein PF003_g222 [Phytophthora fragariae]|nr:hypothetical protein PF003_g222 [Phytophthora fragariae]